MLGSIVTAVAWASHDGPGWETRFRGWLMRYLETGQAPPYETLRSAIHDAEDEAAEFKPTPGERLDGFLARFRR